jgi:hypothetical protein
MVNPTPQRQGIKAFLTPKVADVIVRESLDYTRYTVPSFGAAHPDATRYPDHVLVHAEVVDDQGLWLQLIYANDRSSQDDWNYDITYPYGGDTGCPRLTRTYLLRRATGKIPLDLGSADPGGAFASGDTYLRPDGTSVYKRPGGVDNYLRPNLGPGVLVFQSEKQLPPPLGSTYVQVTRVYDIIPGSTDAEPGSGLSQNDSGYIIERPLGTESFLRLTWKITLPRLIADGNMQSGGMPCPIGGFENLILVSEQINTSEEENQTSSVIRIYEGNVTGAPFPSTEYRIGTELVYPGSLPPDKFLEDVTTIEKEIEIYRPVDQTLTDAAPSGYTLISVKITPDSVLRGKKILVYGLTESLVLYGKQWDDNLETTTTYSVEVMAKDEAEDLDASDEPGVELEVTPYNAYWSIVRKETPPLTSVTAASTIFGGNAITRYGMYPYRWPAVLRPGITGNYIYAGSIPEKRDGVLTGTSILYFDYELTSAWNGLCRARFQTAFSATNPLTAASLIPTDHMEERPIHLDWPGVGRLDVPSCLHPELSFGATTGTTHPDYGYVVYSTEVEATNHQIWPESICADFDVKPYKNGFLVRRVDVYRPFPSY